MKRQGRWWWTEAIYRQDKLMDFFGLDWCPTCEALGSVMSTDSVYIECPRCSGYGIIVEKEERYKIYQKLRKEFEDGKPT